MPLSKEVIIDECKQQQINSPINLTTIFEMLVKVRAQSADDIALQLEENIEQLFFS